MNVVVETSPPNAVAVADMPPAGSAARLIVNRISKSFGDMIAVDDVSCSVSGREFVAVLGPSGSGKTTLFRCIAGLITPDSGSIHIDGDDIASLQGRRRRRIAVVFQQFNLVNRLSALDNVLAGRLGYLSAWRGTFRQFSRSDRLLAMECLDRVGLLSKAAQRADTLSGGQQQRVAIARALCQQPDLIIADEPVASLDPTTGGEVLDLLRDIARSDGVGVACSLHQVHFARNYADRIVGLARGRVVIDCQADAFDEHAYQSLYETRPARMAARGTIS
ncbi:MAG TPA: phosphonate ABC transporter ATP-binding protein [Pseudolabrys sp.]|nr:phosphonate ABC transporter ATP-binding protein [Pseudolabrys sp.]